MLKKIIVLLFIGFTGFSQEIPKEKLVFKEGSIEVKSYDYQNLNLLLQPEDGIVYVVNYWATWCAPCIKELPYFEKLHENYKDKNVKVILVSLDFPKKVQSNLLSFMKRKQLKATVVHLDDPDANSWIEKVASEWSGAIPATLIYDKNQKNFYEQSFTYEALESALQLVLKTN